MIPSLALAQGLVVLAAAVVLAVVAIAILGQGQP